MVLRTSTVSGPIVCLELSPVPAGSVVFVPYSCIIVVQYVHTRSTCCTVLAVIAVTMRCEYLVVFG